MRHEDVHGVSGTGKVADVFEASNGKAIVVWISSNPSVVVYDNIKAVENVHGHGGKTEIIWEWEAPRDPDPMDQVIKQKAAEILSESEDVVDDLAEQLADSISDTEADKEALEDAVAEELAESSADAVSRVADKLAEKLAQRAAAKAAERKNGAEK